MKGPDDLIAREDNWPTRMGLCFGGERVVFRGKDLLGELANKPWMELYLLGITGRQFDTNQIRLFEALWVLSTSYPDPRIWNNRVTSLAGTARSTGAMGISAAVAISEARIYGFKPIIGAFDFLRSLHSLAKEHESLESLVLSTLKEQRTIPGYARPLTSNDERIGPILKLSEELGLAGGKHVGIALQVEKILEANRYRMKMNVAGLAAALAADQGLTRTEYYHYVIPCFLAGMVPCHIETGSRPAGTFLPVRCSSITYLGKPHRHWNG